MSATALSGALLTPAPAHAVTVAGPTSSATHRTAAAQAAVTESQALALARKTGKSVQATAETTSTSTLSANPDGTLTLVQSTTPVRKHVGGVWKNLDATLTRNPDGSISPQVTTSPLTLSGGGTQPLATMRSGLGTLTLSLPPAFTIKTPTLDGASATYHDVLPGVDLAATAQDTGGFSEVLIVHNASAAANPALASLALNTTTIGLALHTDTAGNITATDKTGRAVITAPAASMWDSATPATTVPTTTDSATGQAVDAHTGNPMHSGPLSPGVGAHVKRLKTTYATGRITLAPDRALLTGKATAYPLYIDPAFTPSGQTDVQQAWAYVSSEYYDQAYWNPAPPSAQNPIGPLHVGYIDDTQDYPNYISTDRSFIRVGIGSGVWGAQVISSNIAFHENWSYSCTPSEVDLWQTGAISSTTTSQNQPQWMSQLGTATVAHGANSSCGPADVNFGIKSLMQSASDGKWSNITFGLRASTTDESSQNQNSWKQFSNSAVITTKYDHAPNKPASMTTSPVTTCPSTAVTASALGKGDVTLRAAVSDPDGTISPLTAQFVLTNTNTGATYPQNIGATSGTIAQATYSHTATSGPFQALSAKTEFSWNLTVTDQNMTSPVSATCYFYYDPTAPGPPDVAPINATTSYCPDLAATDADPTADKLCAIGTATGFTITDTNTTTGAPSGYLYQLNNAAPLNIPAGTDSKYTATVSLKPTRQTNILTVTAVSSVGNIGGVYSYQFLANAPATAADGDLTGDGHADLLAVGGQDSLPPGLWLARGNGDGTANPAASNIGIDGNGVNTTATPDSFNGTQTITGHFHTGTGFNDVLDYGYDPTAETVHAEILFGQGDGSPIDPVQTLPVNDAFGVFTMTVNGVTYYATSLANGGDLFNNANGNPDTGYPDLLMLVDGVLYDEPSFAAAANYGSGGLSANGVPLADDNPYCLAQNAANSNAKCTTDWTGWTITSAIDKSTDLPALFARDTNTSTSDPSAGQLWYLPPAMLATALSSGGPVTALAVVPAAASGWDSVNRPFIQAADINGDGTPDLWTLAVNGTPTAQLMTLSGTTATLKPISDPPLQTASHTWPLSDYTGTAAHDYAASGGLDLTGIGGITANGGDQFDPDIKLDGTTARLCTGSAGACTSSGAVALTGSFTLSTWAKPTALGGAVLSQDGSADSGFTITPTSSGWQFALNTGSGTASTFDTITGGSVQLGAWSHLTATYDAGTQVMSLYIDDVYVANRTHTAPATGATGSFQIGADQNAGTHGAYFAGQVAQVQVWNGAALAPAQPYTPGAYHQALTPTRLLDTRTSNVTYSNNPPATPVGAYSTTTLQITGDSVTPSASGAPAQIPATATAVSVDLTITDATAAGYLIAYPDGTQQPLTSTTNYTTSGTTTGFQVVPIGLDGKIALYNGSSGSADLIVDATGYFTTDPGASGDQTYHPLPPSRALDTRSSIAHTTGLASTGPVPSGTTFTLQIAGYNNVPPGASAVALNLTTTLETGSGYLQAYATGTPPAGTRNTTLTYNTSTVATLGADIPLSAGGSTNGSISIYNYGAATDIIADIQGYYTSDTSGDVYHTVAPTRLVDTRIDLGGAAGSHAGPIGANITYTLSQSDTALITTAAQPTLALNLTATLGTSGGYLTAYPAGTTQPAISNLNYDANQSVGNLALVATSTATGTGANAGQVAITNTNSGTVQLVIDCAGYFADDGPALPAHDWPLNDGTGTTASDTVGSSTLSLNATGTGWTTDLTHGAVLSLDGAAGYAASSGSIINTAKSYTISAWVKPTTTSVGAAVSQDGTNISGFILYINSSDSWSFAMATSDSTTWSADSASTANNTATPGAWTHLVGTYDATSGTMSLYVNGALAATGQHTNAWNATGPFVVGRDKIGGANSTFFNGQVSDVQTWNYALSATQATTL